MVAPFLPPGLDAPVRPNIEQLRRIAELMGHVAEQANGVAQRHVRTVLALVDEAKQEAMRELRKWTTTIPDGAMRYTAHQHRLAVLQLQKVQGILERRLPNAILTAMRRGRTDLSSMAIDHLIDEAARFAEVFDSPVSVLSQVAGIRRAEAIAAADKLVIPRIESSTYRYGQRLLGRTVARNGVRGLPWTARIQREFAKGVLRRETWAQITERLVKIGGPTVEISVEQGAAKVIESIPEGLFRRYRHRAEMVVRTELSNVYCATKVETGKELERQDPGWLKRWDSTADILGSKRISPCPICYPLDGEVVGMDEEFSIGLQHAPAHPN